MAMDPPLNKRTADRPTLYSTLFAKTFNSRLVHFHDPTMGLFPCQGRRRRRLGLSFHSDWDCAACRRPWRRWATTGRLYKKGSSLAYDCFRLHLFRLRLPTHSPSFFLRRHSVELHSFARSCFALTACSFFSASRLLSHLSNPIVEDLVLGSVDPSTHPPIHPFIHSSIQHFKHACQDSRRSGSGRWCQPRQCSRLRSLLDHRWQFLRWFRRAVGCFCRYRYWQRVQRLVRVCL